jgi:hypothetical protein
MKKSHRFGGFEIFALSTTIGVIFEFLKKNEFCKISTQKPPVLSVYFAIK